MLDELEDLSAGNRNAEDLVLEVQWVQGCQQGSRMMSNDDQASVADPDSGLRIFLGSTIRIVIFWNLRIVICQNNKILIRISINFEDLQSGSGYIHNPESMTQYGSPVPKN